jgi:hypothetical protein
MYIMCEILGKIGENETSSSCDCKYIKTERVNEKPRVLASGSDESTARAERLPFSTLLVFTPSIKTTCGWKGRHHIVLPISLTGLSLLGLSLVPFHPASHLPLHRHTAPSAVLSCLLLTERSQFCCALDTVAGFWNVPEFLECGS